MRAALCCVLFALALVSGADEPESRKKAIAELTKVAEGRAKATKLEADWSALLPAAKVGVIDGKVKDVTIPDKIDKKNPVRFPSAKAKSDYVAELDEKLKGLRGALKEWKSSRPEDLAEPLTLTKGGEVGRMPHKRVRVATVIDKESALIATVTNKPDVTDRDDNITVIVSGVDTSKWADGIAIDSPPGIWMVGTQKRGGKTYLHLTPLVLTKEEAESVMKATKP